MNLENALYYVTHRSESIIQWLFLTILLLALAVIGRSLFGKKNAESSAGTKASPGGSLDGSSTEIQAFLEKILQQTAKLESVSMQKMDPATVAQADAQIQTLKKELASREEELHKANAKGDSKNSQDAEKLSVRIKELESKLAEYEILEDDIADLSLYKEENARLRVELNKIKGMSTTSAAGPAEGEPSGKLPATGEDIVAEFAEAVSQQTESNGGAEIAIAKTSDPLADFENAVNLEKKLMANEGGGEPAVVTPSPASRPTPSLKAVPSATPLSVAAQVEAAEGDDLFAEFAKPPVEAEVAAEGGLDTDKMMEEMAALVSVEGSGGGALEEGIDTEKMALEANSLTKS